MTIASLHLSPACFSRTILMVRMHDGAHTEIERFSYETRDALYDLDVYFGAIVACRVNCASVAVPVGIHHAINAHFKLGASL